MENDAGRLVVAISGASGVILGIRMLEALRPMPIEAHLVLSPAARLTIQQETSWKVKDITDLADVFYNHADITAPLASGSYRTRGMVIIPCSVKTLSAVANSYSNDLISRAADVTLKEGRPLVLVVRESPLHLGHLRLMTRAVEIGAIIVPPVPAFYVKPKDVDQMIDHMVGRVLLRLGIENRLYSEWKGAREELDSDGI